MAATRGKQLLERRHRKIPYPGQSRIFQKGLNPLSLDNAGFHKKEATQNVIAQAGCTLEFLPTDSLVFNPIEHKWAQAKAIRRKLQCSVDEILQRSMI